MSTLEDLFRQTFDDHVFTRDERRAMAKILQEENLDEKELGILRSKVFNIAMDELDDTDADRVLEWLRQAVKLLLPDGAPAFRYDVYFSPDDDCPRAIIKCIEEARASMDICVFTISDNRISRAIEAAEKRGIDVRIISDNDKSFDKGSDVVLMASRGLSVKLDDTSNHMHHKFAIFDNNLLLTGSYNWTVSAANHNEENILITNQPEIVAPFQKEFRKLWKRLEHL
ncbi:MAG: phospholipase D-like domain-containing protein [Bacteroidia bacterium]|nr:phospholipase D-like domain-containing protein [Bacteroidia bacterium]